MGQLEINYFEFRFNYLECNFFLLMFFSFRSGFKRPGFPHLYPFFPWHLTQRRAKPSHRRRVIAVVP